MKALNLVAGKYFSHKANKLQMSQECLQKSQEKLWSKMRRDLQGTRIYSDLKLDLIEDYNTYAQHLPVVDWDFYAPYVDLLIKGDNNVLFNDSVEYFGLTSGTSGQDSKRIPYNSKMIKTFLSAQKNTASVISSVAEMNMLSASRLTFGSCPTSYNDGNFNFGYISGILSTKTPRYLKKNTFPSAKTLHIENWDKKVEAIISESLDKDINVISGIPTYIITILETILEKTGKKHIAEIWPNLKVFIYGATPITQYKDRINELVGSSLEYFGIYAATEAPIGISYRESTYVPNPDILYSFNPLNDKQSQLSIKDLQVGEKYYVNIGTPNGFLNYAMKDIIRIVSLDDVVEFEICGRENTGMNLAAEKVADQQIMETISKTRVSNNIDIRHFFVSPQMKNGRPAYLWTLFVSDAHNFSRSELAINIDETLRDVCADYNDCRVEGVIEQADVNFKSLDILESYFLENQHKGQFKMKTSFPLQNEFESFLQSLEGVIA